MDNLFLKLLSECEKFINLISEAENQLKPEKNFRGGLSEITIKEWRKFVNAKKTSFERLKTVINEKDINLTQLNSCLVGFRQATRYFSEVACHWSTSYDDIKLSLRNVVRAVNDIDHKYTLGNVKIRKEKNEKNNLH